MGHAVWGSTDLPVTTRFFSRQRPSPAPKPSLTHSLVGERPSAAMAFVQFISSPSRELSPVPYGPEKFILLHQVSNPPPPRFPVFL